MPIKICNLEIICVQFSGASISDALSECAEYIKNELENDNTRVWSIDFLASDDDAMVALFHTIILKVP